MRNGRLRVFQEAGDASDDGPASPSVHVPLGDFFPLLADAVIHERSWIRDFKDEKITISADLYELIRAYEHYHRPSA